MRFYKKMVPDSLAVSDSFVPSDHFQPLLGWGLRGEGLGGASSSLPPQQASGANLPRPRPSPGWGGGLLISLSPLHRLFRPGGGGTGLFRPLPREAGGGAFSLVLGITFGLSTLARQAQEDTAMDSQTSTSAFRTAVSLWALGWLWLWLPLHAPPVGGCSA